MSGVTSRTLRHYDDIGLLKPAFLGANGYRYYEVGELLRLQQILVLRELGVGLADIGETLDETADAWARCVVTTPASSTKAAGSHGFSKRWRAPRINRPENLFEGFDPSAYEAEAAERWPEEHDRSTLTAAGFTPEQLDAEQRKVTARMIRMAEPMVAGVPVDDPATQEEVDWHFRSYRRFWSPDADAFTELGRMYAADARFRANYDRIAGGLAEYQRDAISAYAAARLR